MNLGAARSKVWRLVRAVLIAMVAALVILGVMHVMFYLSVKQAKKELNERGRAIETSLTAMARGPVVLTDQTLVRVVLKNDTGEVQYYTHWDNKQKREVRDKPMVETMTLAQLIEQRSEVQLNRAARASLDSLADRYDDGMGDYRDPTIVTAEWAESHQHYSPFEKEPYVPYEAWKSKDFRVRWSK